MGIGISTRGENRTRLRDDDRRIRRVGQRARLEQGRTVLHGQVRRIVHHNRRRVSDLTTDHWHRPRQGSLVERARVVTGDGSWERDVIRAREHEVTAVHHNAGIRTHVTRGRSCRDVFIRVDVVTTDDEVRLVGTECTRESRGIAQHPEVR